MIGTHNSYTFLPAKKHWLEWFSFLWRTQVKSIEQQREVGVAYFDIRVRYDKDISMWRVCHGIVDFNRVFGSLESIAGAFSDKKIRLILERGDKDDESLFTSEVKVLIDNYSGLSFSCIKKGWKVLYNKDPHIFDYTYTPWLSGVSFWDNIKRFNFFSTIKRWAKKHNPVINDILKKDSTNVYFMDYV